VPYNGGIVTFDDRLRDTLDRAFAGARANLAHDVLTLAHELADTTADERGRAAAAEIDELRRSGGAAMAELATATRALDSAGSLGDVLQTLVDSARRYVDRVALVVVRDGRWHPWTGEGTTEGVEANRAATFPLTVGGRVVAVLHVDAAQAGDGVPSSRWSATLDVLTAHASRVLESMTLYKSLGLTPPRPERPQ